MDFTTAYKRLQEITATLQSQEIMDIDKLVELQKEAKKCYEACKEQVKKGASELETPDSK